MCAALLVARLLWLWPRCRREVRPLNQAICAVGLFCACYQFWVGVPMYRTRWIADAVSGRQYRDVAQGRGDASSRWIASHRWSDWRSEVVWMSLSFKVVVWLGISLSHLTGLSRVSLAGHGRMISRTLQPRRPAGEAWPAATVAMPQTCR